MKTIGLIGGMSWESSTKYYQMINTAVKARLGGLHSAKCLLYSVDFAEIEALQNQGNWDGIGHELGQAASNLEQAGADVILLCTNTMHKVADAIQTNIRVPFLHIADATAQVITKRGLKRIGLLGTRFTMEESFYTDRLIQTYGLDVRIPPLSDRELIHRVIYEELCVGQILQASKQQYARIIADLVMAGAEGIILGCTEIGLLVHDEDSSVPLFDTTTLHAVAAVDFALTT